jgi:hypothetical protein
MAAKSETKLVKSSARKPVFQRATPVARLLDGAVEQVEQEADPVSQKSHRVSWDFSKIPLFPPDRPQPTSQLVAPPPLLGAIQTKLNVGSVNDPLEKEADRVAEHVMQMTSSDTIQRKCEACEENKQERFDAAQGAEGDVTVEEEAFGRQNAIFLKATLAAPPPPALPVIAERFIESGSGGEPLPADTRYAMERVIGHDFSRVRIHHGAEAEAMNRRLSALAFTHHNHIYFGDGRYNLATSEGTRLLAHELTHVAQQGYATHRERGSGIVSRASPSVIQRTATWKAAAANEVNNLADTFINGADVGTTNPVLNGSVLATGADTRVAIARPKLAFGPGATGGVAARVDTVPTNTGSFRENVLKVGPWTLNTTKAAVHAAFPSLASCTGAGNSTFQAIGKPTDAEMKAANRRHEDHHATDFQVSFVTAFIPWDVHLTVAAAVHTAFQGADQPAAERALWTAMGGTPDDVADNFTNACATAIANFHGTPKGGNVTTDNPTANADCSQSSVESTNPS